MIQIEKILKSTRYVVDNSEHVKINQGQIKKFCDNIESIDNISLNWLENTPFDLKVLDEKEKANFVLLFNALSFSYWGTPYWQVHYQNQTFKRGSWSLVASILRAREEGLPILDADYQSSISKDDLGIMLRANRQIPLFKERLEILQSVGSSLKDKYDGDFRDVVAASNDDAVDLLDIITEEFPSFSDTAQYKEKTIYFQKRAQALVQSTHSFLRKLTNIDRLTALADYIVPKELYEKKILEYSPELEEKIENRVVLATRGIYVNEIRANTIWAVKYIAEELYNIQATQMGINDYLWLTGGNKDTQFMLTRTTDF